MTKNGYDGGHGWWWQKLCKRRYKLFVKLTFIYVFCYLDVVYHVKSLIAFTFSLLKVIREVHFPCKSDTCVSDTEKHNSKFKWLSVAVDYFAASSETSTIDATIA